MSKKILGKRLADAVPCIHHSLLADSRFRSPTSLPPPVHSFLSMKKTIVLGSLGMAACLLASCTAVPGSPSPVSQETASSAADTNQQSFEGTLQKAGVSIYMEGTHRLYTADNQPVLLESSTVNLDDYLDKNVRVTGDARPTVEHGGILVRVLHVDLLPSGGMPTVETGAEISSATVSSADVSAQAMMVASSSSPSSAHASSSFKKAPVHFSSSASSLAPSAQTSSAAADASPLSQRTAAMATAKVDGTTFTQEYCSRHVGFCVPVHHSWFYYSFGTTSSYLWHVEVSSEEITNLGDGPLIINLISGDLPSTASDGSIADHGSFIVGYRAWTNNRHFEISAPASLRTAVGYIVAHLSVYHVDQETSSGSALSSSASSIKTGTGSHL